MTTYATDLIGAIIAQGIITQDEFDKKVEEYSIPVRKERELIETIKNPIRKYEDIIEGDSSDIEAVRASKIESLKYLCSQSVYAGFKSERLKHSFGFNEHDQSNITQQILLMVMGNVNPVSWKTLDAGVITLTKDQFMVLVDDAKNHKIDNQKRFWQIEQDVLAAESIEEIKEINW